MNTTESTMTVGRLAREAQVNVETVRYYERRGLMPEPDRSRSGYRRYGPGMVRRLRFIKRAQELGFSLDEISELLSLSVTPDTTCAEVRDRAETKVADIEERIGTLERMKEQLTELIEACNANRLVDECPILEAMEDSSASHDCPGKAAKVQK